MKHDEEWHERNANKEPKHPMQEVVMDGHGVIRFKRNQIIRDLLDTSSLDLNQIVIHYQDPDRKPDNPRYTQADLEQLYQLIGYSVDGYHELNDTSDKTRSKAWRAYQKLASPDPA